MPVRRRVETRPQPMAVNPLVLSVGDGCWHFRGNAYPDRAAAERAWRRPGVRRLVWVSLPVGHIPGASEAYDGFTREAFDILWRSLTKDSYELKPVLAGLVRDRASVAAFREREGKATADIRDVLELWSGYLDTVETAARLRVSRNVLHDGIADLLTLLAGPTTRTYGEVAAKNRAVLS